MVIFLAYKDVSAADQEKQTLLRRELGRDRRIVQLENLLVLIDSRDETQDKLVGRLVQNMDVKPSAKDKKGE